MINIKDIFKAMLIDKYLVKKGYEGSPAVQRWNNVQDRVVRNASSESKVVNKDSAAPHIGGDFKASWHPSNGDTIVSNSNGQHANGIRAHGGGKHFNQWVRGAYFKDANEYHTRAWHDSSSHPEHPYATFDEPAQNRSDKVQTRSFEAMKNSGMIPKNAVHVKNSNDSTASERTGKRFK